MFQFFVTAASWLLAMLFAAVWGAHVFDTAVLFPVWASEPPKSLLEYQATPYPMRIVSLFRRLVPALFIVAVIVVLVASVTGLRTRLALAVAGVCGLIHMAIIVLVFLPTNRKLGFLPGRPGASNLDSQVVKMLVQRWGRWNLVRLGVDTAGLIAALFAFKTS